ncbi:MAG: hypothetical protein ABIJ47_16265 [Candidatus Bathyarchaeota archaeon]
MHPCLGDLWLAWRSKYVDWFRVVQGELGELLPSLSDAEVIECVTVDDEANIPLGDRGKPLPALHLKVGDGGVTLAVRYDEKSSMDHLSNVLNEAHSEQRRMLLRELAGLDARYQTRLYRRQRDSEKLELTRNYLSGRLDEQLLSRLLDEAEAQRRGGARVEQGRSIYQQPTHTSLSFIEVSTGLDPVELREAAGRLRPVLELLLGIRTQREIIKERLEKPRKRVNLYKEYVDMLNEARGMGLISAEKRRELDRQWRENPGDRDSLMADLRRLLGPRE